MNCKRKSRRWFFLLMRSRTPPISSEFGGGRGSTLQTTPSVRHWLKRVNENNSKLPRLSHGRTKDRRNNFENCISYISYLYTGCPRRKGPNFGRVFLKSNYTDITQNTYIQGSMVRRYWPEKFETLTAITHLLIIKYILKLAGICGFCNVNIFT